MVSDAWTGIGYCSYCGDWCRLCSCTLDASAPLARSGISGGPAAGWSTMTETVLKTIVDLYQGTGTSTGAEPGTVGVTQNPAWCVRHSYPYSDIFFSWYSILVLVETKTKVYSYFHRLELDTVFMVLEFLTLKLRILGQDVSDDVDKPQNYLDHF